jgi:hypothetical protein
MRVHESVFECVCVRGCGSVFESVCGECLRECDGVCDRAFEMSRDIEAILRGNKMARRRSCSS